MEKNLGKLLDHAPEQGVEEPCCSVPDIGTIWVRRATREELPELYALIKREVGDVASFEVLERVFNKKLTAFGPSIDRVMTRAPMRN